MFVLTALSGLMVVLAFGLRENRGATSSPLGTAASQSASNALQEAFGTQGFWLLTIGFFVCGFHVSFIGLHLPSYISDNSIGMSFFGRPISGRSCCFLLYRCLGSPCCCLQLRSASCGWARFR
jgi:hypothetical protein